VNTITDYKIKKMSPLFLVADIERSIEFYTKKLGFSIDFRYEDFYAGIIKDGFSIHLKTGEHSIDIKQNKKGNGHIDITFAVEDIELLYKVFSIRSMEITQPLRGMPYGKEFYVADLDGHILAFLE
jgi:catechol 2,3-dioxygenase-like lactoylglutathione lyase family enzyme